jgi:hypothetical protein
MLRIDSRLGQLKLIRQLVARRSRLSVEQQEILVRRAGEKPLTKSKRPAPKNLMAQHQEIQLQKRMARPTLFPALL